jgi:luciferase family oxidoreductase group 1
MLPNHAPLKVAETFRVLEALHPKRIDLGIGRAPGTDPVTSTALRRSPDVLEAEDFPQRFGELLAFSGEGFGEDHPFRSVVAMPSDVGLLPVWLLGSSGYSARAAGQVGLGCAFASHFSPADPAPAMRAYRESFEPLESFERPSAILAVAVVCRENDEHAERLGSSMELAWVRRRSGSPGPLPSAEEVMAYPNTPAERRLTDAYRSMQVVGGSRTGRARIEELAEHTAADEDMITTNVYDHARRLRSNERLAEIFDIATPCKEV